MSPMFQSLGKWGCQLTSSDALSGRQHQQAPMQTVTLAIRNRIRTAIWMNLRSQSISAKLIL